MKVVSLTFLLGVLALSGCATINASDLDEFYENVTSGEKTVKKAFKLYELYTLDEPNMLDGCKEECRYTTNQEWPYNGESVYDMSKHPYANHNDISDFMYRFCRLNDFVYEEDSVRALIVRMFDKKTDLSISDKERYCLALRCDGYPDAWGNIRINDFVHNEDECLVIRRNLVGDTTKNIQCQCVFNYKMYLPDDVKISTHERFVKLYKAYTEDIDKCKFRELTATERDNCVDTVEKKFEQLVKSGILK
jgi:hypothetical protein